MAKRCILVDPTAPVNTLQSPLDWSRCILCQEKTREKLQCPAMSFRSDIGAGYESLAKILPAFAAIGEVPSHLVQHICPTMQDFFQTNAAKWHKTCRNKYSARELTRKSGNDCVQLLTEVDDDLPDVGLADDGGPLLPSKRPCTRSEVPSINVLGAVEPVCFSVKSQLVLRHA